MELNFNDIIAGKEAPKPEKAAETVQLKKSDTRARQQSCMIHYVDKSLLPEGTKAPVENFRVSLVDMLNLDKHDESLEKYKQTLLGYVKEDCMKEDEPAYVYILMVYFVCPSRPKGNIVMDFRTFDLKQPWQFTIKEGSLYTLRVHFMVRNDIVFGLKFVNNVYKMFAKVDKDEYKMGSFAPQVKPHTFDLTTTEAPSGFLARGDYKGKGLFLDNDGIVHCQFDYIMTISTEW